MDEVEDVGITPGLGRHAGCTPCTTYQHALGQIVVGIHGLTPGSHLGALETCQVDYRIHERARARSRTVLHALDRGTAWAYLTEVQQQHFIASLLEGHQIDLLDGLGPTLTAVRHHEMSDLAATVQVLCGAWVDGLDLPGETVLVEHVDDRDGGGQLRVVDLHHGVVVGTAYTGTIEQQVEGQEARRGG